MHTDSVRCLNPTGFHNMVYHEWGSAENDRVIVCVHGLARNSRDFDELALALSRDYRVVCPDIVGRGESDWLPAGQVYGLPQYLNDINTLLARLNVDQVDWIGTSMGGIIGMSLAALPNSPIKHLVLNDIGAFVPATALARISDYLGDKRFETIEAVEAYMRNTYVAFKDLSDSQWRHLVKHGCKPLDDGSYCLHYDPAIAQATQAAVQDVDLWPVWSAVNIPQLLIWGEESDVLQEETVRKMQANDKLDLYSVPGVPHVPSLMESDQIHRVQQWLRDHRK
ncbi:alpha/beta fold hydrolase [Neptuniibacter caesariensis]|uniref:Putative Esterase/lipase/thioesterase family protein n=1 Tax=Neptuniibacter caesariensis TaxID=207954 RepID=A0A7U8GR31_NEPCE|nr:alpha/beta hydrolase [Neptuniibacter caesariensis]EAR59788.1 putative Esterase/lipase/thioesterase family protein [Oceanospirillum sp. MED92] [Neptuniibacter caesariensis]